MLVPVATITALGLDGALRTAHLTVTGTANSRIESIPALIVISVVERADVIVRTYEAPAMSGALVSSTAIMGLSAPVMESTFTLSLVD